MARTAHLLNIHRNTLVYRLSRITEILQLDMDDSNVRLNLHLALKINRLLTTF
jgi:purine catabolism regulator